MRSHLSQHLVHGGASKQPLLQAVFRAADEAAVRKRRFCGSVCVAIGSGTKKKNKKCLTDEGKCCSLC